MTRSPTDFSADDLDHSPTLRGLRAGTTVFGRHTLLRQLGRGGMGVVWLAHDTKLDLDMALKFLPAELVHDEVALNDLRRETRRCMKLTHQHIVHVFDLVDGDDTAAIAMEHVDGPSLSALRLQQPHEVFEVAVLAPLLQQVCEALTYAHERGGVVHYDLKPGNLMVTSGGQVKVMDFGIAASLNDSHSRQSRASSSTAGMGTRHYMSPQQLAGFPPGVSDDVYSLGATIYELITSKPPFHGFRDRALEQQVETAVPPSMTQRRADLQVESGAVIPPAWEEVVAACLEKDPAKRPPSVAELWRLISSAPGNQTVPSEAAAAARSSSKKAVLLFTVVMLCLGGAAGAWWYGMEAPRRAEASRLEQQRQDEAAAQAAAAARMAKAKEDAEAARVAKEKADAEAARVAKEKTDAAERQRQIAAQVEAARQMAAKDDAERLARKKLEFEDTIAELAAGTWDVFEKPTPGTTTTGTGRLDIKADPSTRTMHLTAALQQRSKASGQKRPNEWTQHDENFSFSHTVSYAELAKIWKGEPAGRSQVILVDWDMIQKFPDGHTDHYHFPAVAFGVFGSEETNESIFHFTGFTEGKGTLEESINRTIENLGSSDSFTKSLSFLGISKKFVKSK